MKTGCAKVDYSADYCYCDLCSEANRIKNENEPRKARTRHWHNFLLEKYKNCFYCRKELTINSITIEHLMAKNGVKLRYKKHIWKETNLRAACGSCNTRAGKSPLAVKFAMRFRGGMIAL